MYGPDMPATMDRLAVLLAKVLGGVKPSEIPIERPVKFEFLINQKTARAIGLTIPDTVLVRADEVIR